MDAFVSYLQKQTAAAAGHLGSFERTGDQEELHQFRVAMKKMNAAAVFLSVHFPTAGKPRKKLKRVFRAAGLIREQQLRMEWLRRNRLQLLAVTADAAEDLQFFLSAFGKEKEHNKKVVHRSSARMLVLAHEMPREDIITYAFLQREAVFPMLAAASQEYWHELRKQIKQLLYALHWMEPADQVRCLRVKEVQYLDHLQEVIGAWHDLCDLKQWMSDQQFFLHSDAGVRKAFTKGWSLLQTGLSVAEKTVLKQLSQHRQKLSLSAS
jgi:CHAD domain-containing protein